MTIASDRWCSDFRDRVINGIGALPAFKGRDRFGAQIAKLLNVCGEPVALARLHDGTSVYVDIRSPDHWSAFVFHTYDPILVSSIKQVLIEPGTVFVDVGASVGLISLSLAKHVRSLGGRIIAYEPYPPNFHLLEKSVTRNDFRELVDLYPFALGKEAAAVRLILSESTASVGNAVIQEEDQVDSINGSMSRSSRMMRLDDHVRELGLKRIDCIKIDVEGFELDVLAGAVVTVKVFAPVIFGEFNTDWMRKRGLEPEKVWDELVDQMVGYMYFSNTNSEWKKLESMPLTRCWNLKMIPIN